MPSSTNQNNKAKEKFREALKGCARAVSGNEDLQMTFGQDGPTMTGDSILLPDLPLKPTASDVKVMRGMADSLSLKASCHNASAHQKRVPYDADARKIYDALEEVRYEMIGSQRMAGMEENLWARQQNELETRYTNPIFSSDDVALHTALSLLAREAMQGKPLAGKAADVAHHWREELAQKSDDLFSSLSKVIHDQDAYSTEIMNLLETLNIETGADKPGSEEGDSDSEVLSDDSEDLLEDQDGGLPDEDSSDGEADPSDDSDGDEREDTDYSDQSIGDGDAEQQTNPAQEQAALPNFSVLEVPEAFGYKIFTKRFDEVVTAEDLAQPSELERLRGLLDRQLESLNRAVSRLANKLQRKLLAQQNRSWEFDLEEGVLDAARLSRVVTDPLSPLSFRQEADTEFRDTVVTLLIDNSGSMRGRPIMIAASCADIFARTLERCGVKVEILGFTTKAWKGGDARGAWEEAGKPGQPGRLNDIRHIIFKTADSPWRRVRNNLGLMMREGLLKENIDGEALTWAHKRLLARPEQRRILMVISDGAPVDDSTLSVNPGNFLEQHLRNVIDEIETRSKVELIAIGIGHDVTRYYKRAVTITDAEDLAGAMIDKLTELFDEKSKK
ncbi:MAG: cobaltochelatase subunit CobT [Rhizobiales bacterium]|nr:cobaltochelatase subunit CobT [Hyphomicrobiales bacterium]